MTDHRESADTPHGPVDLTALRDAVGLIRSVHRKDFESAEEILRPYIEGPIRLVVETLVESGQTRLKDLPAVFGSEMANFRSLVQALSIMGELLGRNLAEWAERPFEELLEHYSLDLAGGKTDESDGEE